MRMASDEDFGGVMVVSSVGILARLTTYGGRRCDEVISTLVSALWISSSVWVRMVSDEDF